MKLIQWIFDKIATSFVNKKTGDLLKDEKFANQLKIVKMLRKECRKDWEKNIPMLVYKPL